MEYSFSILRAIIMSYNKYNVTGYKSYMSDGFTSLISTKDSYILYFHQGDHLALDMLHTPYGKIKVSTTTIDNDLYKLIYDEILSRIKGIFITPNILLITIVDNIKIHHPLIKFTPYTNTEIIDVFYNNDFKPNQYISNIELQKLIKSEYIQDSLGILNSLITDTEDHTNYYKAIDTINEMKLNKNSSDLQFIINPRVYNKFGHILGLLLLSDTPIKGLTY